MPVSHDDILSKLDAMGRRLDEHEIHRNAFRDATSSALERVMRALTVVSETVESCEDRVKGIEGKVLAYDRLKDRVTGGIAAVGVAFVAIWWLVGHKLAAILGIEVAK